MSAYEAWTLPLDDALKNEYRYGIATVNRARRALARRGSRRESGGMGNSRNSALLKLKMARLSAGLVAQYLLFIAPGIVLAQQFAAVSVPLPVEIDGQPTHCRLY